MKTLYKIVRKSKKTEVPIKKISIQKNSQQKNSNWIIGVLLFLFILFDKFSGVEAKPCIKLPADCENLEFDVDVTNKSGYRLILDYYNGDTVEGSKFSYKTIGNNTARVSFQNRPVVECLRLYIFNGTRELVDKFEAMSCVSTTSSPREMPHNGTLAPVENNNGTSNKCGKNCIIIIIIIIVCLLGGMIGAIIIFRPWKYFKKLLFSSDEPPQTQVQLISVNKRTSF